MSTRLDWEITRGDTDELAFGVAIKGKNDLAPVSDISGATVYAYLRDTRRATVGTTPMTTLILSSADPTEIEITDAPAGELRILLTYDDLVDEGLTGTPGELVRIFYSLRVHRADGERKTCAHGYLTVLIGGDA